MRAPLTILVMALLPLMAAAQWHGAPAARTAPLRSPMAGRAVPTTRPFMVRPAPFRPAMPVRGGLPFRPAVPGVIPQFPQGQSGFHSGHIGLTTTFGFGRFPFGVPPQNRCFSDAFFDPFFCTRRPVPFAPFGGFGAFGAFPFFSLPVVSDSGQDYADMAAQQVAQQNAQASAQANDLTMQIEQLREELQQMRQQPAPAPAAAPASADPGRTETPPTPTTLVFRDGRRSQVENYAIVGNTLWVFNDQRRTKIPMAELDLKATTQVNENRGVDFVVPSSAK